MEITQENSIKLLCPIGQIKFEASERHHLINLETIKIIIVNVALRLINDKNCYQVN